MVTSRQENEYLEAVIDDLLDKSIVWINENLDPDGVFDEDILKDWAESHGYIEEE